MPHLVHLKNDGETTCFSQKRQKEKQLFWNVFWPITCLNLLKKNAQTQQAMHCVRFPCAWIMDKLISKCAKEEQRATTNILTDSVIFYGLWTNTIKPYIEPWRIFSALHFIWNATVFINVQLDPVSSSKLEPFDQQHFVWQQTRKPSPLQCQQI